MLLFFSMGPTIPFSIFIKVSRSFHWLVWDKLPRSFTIKIVLHCKLLYVVFLVSTSRETAVTDCTCPWHLG